MSLGFLSCVGETALLNWLLIVNDCPVLNPPAFASILTAVIITMVGVGIEKPNTGAVHGTIDTNLYEAFQAVCQIVFSFCMASPAFS